MRIGIDAFPLCSRAKTGIGNYLYNILIKLEDIDKENEYFLYSICNFDLPFKNSHWHKRVLSREIFKNFGKIGVMWFLLIGGKWILRKDKIDIFWGANHVMPFHLSAKKVLTVHDLSWEYFPKTMKPAAFLIRKLFMKRWSLLADRIITDSYATMESLQSLYGVPSNKVSTIYLAANKQYRPCSKEESSRYIAEKFRVSSKYVLTVGTIEPRKNILGLLKTYRILIDKFRFDYQLLIVGIKGRRIYRIYRAYRRLKFDETHVKFLGYIPDKDMPKLYSGAELFIYPSLYEGFGLPPLEAMACGCPVITSNVSSLPEVVGDAGITADPRDFSNFASIIYNISKDKKLKIALKIKGLERAKRFSWEISARRILAIFQTLQK